MNRTTDKYWIWIGLLLGAIYPFGYVKVPDVSLIVLSIFFGGLLAIVSILPSVQSYNNIKFIKKSGHIKDLIDYIKIPLNLSFALIVIEFINKTIIIPEIDWYMKLVSILCLSLWGVFLLSLLRILLVVPKIIVDDT